jgi:epoxyqueuosine reductase
MSLNSELRQFAREEAGVVALGVTDGSVLREGTGLYRQRIARGFLTAGRTPRRGFEPADLRLRFDPRRSLKSVRTVICAAVPYNVEFLQASKPRYAGQVARVGWGRDYHLVVGERLRKIVQFLRDGLGDLEAVTMVDTGPLQERGFAVRAGIGWIGKNNTLIVPQVGSFVFLGEVLVDRELEPDEPMRRDCGACRKCIEACPTGALVEPYMLDTRRCLSFLTQIPELAPQEVVPKLDGRLYGCDVCQEVCPHNVAAPKIGDREFLPAKLLPKPDLAQIVRMDARSYIDVVGGTSVEWVGRTVLQKNAVVALGRYAVPEAAGLIQNARQDPRSAIRAAAELAARYQNSNSQG